jgi:CO dehydrogenase nickel-insertion accessory protein CooC1
LLAALDDKAGRVVLVDLGGGVMTVARGDESQIDALVVVVEPYPRSTEVARRLLEMAAAKNITRWFVVANKVESDQDLEMISDLLGAEPDIVIPKDGAVSAADRVGASPIDHEPSSPAIGTLRQLASSLLADA